MHRCFFNLNFIFYIQKFQTSRGHLCILSRIYFPIASLVREKSENYNDIYNMAFALKGKMLKIVEEKEISTCGRGYYVMLSHAYVMN